MKFHFIKSFEVSDTEPIWAVNTSSIMALRFCFILLPSLVISQDLDITDNSPPLLTFDSFSNGLSNSNSPILRNNINTNNAVSSYRIKQDKFLPLEGKVFQADNKTNALDLAIRAEAYFRPNFLKYPVSHGWWNSETKSVFINIFFLRFLTTMACTPRLY